VWRRDSITGCRRRGPIMARLRRDPGPRAQMRWHRRSIAGGKRRTHRAVAPLHAAASAPLRSRPQSEREVETLRPRLRRQAADVHTRRCAGHEAAARCGRAHGHQVIVDASVGGGSTVAMHRHPSMSLEHLGKALTPSNFIQL
jgi:hypothetical protein